MKAQSIRGIPIAIGALALLAALIASPASAEPEKSSESQKGRYIVVFEDSVKGPTSVARAQTEQRNGKLGFVYRHAIKGYSAELPKRAVDGLRNDPRVKFVTRDHVLRLFAQTTPTGIDRVFATANEALAINEVDDLRADVDVAVIDTGIDHEHPDLDVVGGADCATEEEGSFECKEGLTGDYQGHGTHVAGTIGAIDNGEGVVGVAPGARLWSVQVHLFFPTKVFESSAMAGVDWVTATREDEDPENDIEVANMSFGCTDGFAEDCESLPALEGAITGAVEAGIVMVAAAGNESTDAKATHPASHPDVIAVSALEDFDGKPGQGGEGKDPLAWFSNYGSVIDVVAPGVSIRSTIPGNKTGLNSGTSMASPHVAGAAAILAAADQPESKEDVEAIRATIVEEGNFDWFDTSGDGVQEPLLDVGNEAVFSLYGAPAATTQSATEISTTTATLNATVNPRGAETSYQFEYGTTTAYGSKAPESPEWVGSGSSPVEVDEPIEGLDPGTTYHFRVVATNQEGTSYGKDVEFTTAGPPAATTEAATGVTDSAATLNATVNPNGLATTYQFEYGETTEYGSEAPGSPQAAGSGTGPVEVDEPIEGLEPGTTYHFRVVATNSAGTTYGEDETFTTKAAWTIQSTANPSSKATLQGVSCATASECIAVGAGNTGVPASQRWNGSEWSALTNADEGGGELTDVSCVAGWSADCIAIPASGLNTQELAPSTGGKYVWTIRTAASPPEGSSPVLRDVSCISWNVCVAVGTYLHEGFYPRTLSELWNGSTWTLLSTPFEDAENEETGEPEANELNAVSCDSETSCTAIGLIGGKPAALRWDGSEWSAIEAPEEASTASADLSCASASSCVAVLGEGAKVQHYFPGYGWFPLTAPTPEGGSSPRLYGIDCASESDCIAVGDYDDGSGVRVLAERWNGNTFSWSAQTPTNPEGALSATFSGVSCVTPSRCSAVGYYEPEEGQSATLAARYDVDPVTEYALPELTNPKDIAAGPDGNLWYVSDGTSAFDKIGKMTTSGVVTEYSLPSGSRSWEITPGPDGNLWFTNELLSKVGKITTSGTITEYAVGCGPRGIAAGPDGKLWFTCGGEGKVGKITTSGTATEYSLPWTGWSWGITSGPDGNLWFTGKTSGNQGRIGKITTSGTATGYSLGSTSFARGITSGPDGNLWFAVGGTDKLGKITTSGTITQYSLAPGSGPWDIVAGSDGNLWFTASDSDRIGQVTTSGSITEYPLPQRSRPQGIAAGSQDKLWFVNEVSGRIGAITP